MANCGPRRAALAGRGVHGREEPGKVVHSSELGLLSGVGSSAGREGSGAENHSTNARVPTIRPGWTKGGVEGWLVGGRGGVGHALHRGWHALQKRLKRLKRPTVTCVSGPQRKKRNLGARNATQISAARCSSVGAEAPQRGGCTGQVNTEGHPGSASPCGCPWGDFWPIFGRFSAIFWYFRHFLPVGAARALHALHPKIAPCVTCVACVTRPLHDRYMRYTWGS